MASLRRSWPRNQALVALRSTGLREAWGERPVSGTRCRGPWRPGASGSSKHRRSRPEACSCRRIQGQPCSSQHDRIEVPPGYGSTLTSGGSVSRLPARIAQVSTATEPTGHAAAKQFQDSYDRQIPSARSTCVQVEMVAGFVRDFRPGRTLMPFTKRQAPVPLIGDLPRLIEAWQTGASILKAARLRPQTGRQKR